MRFCARLFLDELNPRSAGERDRARGEPRAKRDFFFKEGRRVRPRTESSILAQDERWRRA